MAAVQIFKLWITHADGLQPVLVQELTEFGAEITHQQLGRVEVNADLATLYRICIWSRTASRVLLPVHHVDVARADVRDVAEELYQGALDFDWSFIFAVQSPFLIRMQADKQLKLNTQFVTLRVKDGVADAFIEAVGKRPSVDLNHPEIQLFVLAGMTQHSYCLDLSGDSLHRRGYRHAMTDAPLKENLAAAIVLNAGLTKDCRLLFDPMCGSGTLIIEALMILTDRAPGLNRNFGFHAWKQHDHQLWAEIKQQAEQQHQQALTAELPRIYAFDADFEAIQATRANLIAAGFQSLIPQIQLEQRDLAEWPDFVDTDAAFVMCNPPYGERLGEQSTNHALYQGLANRLQYHFSGQYAAVLASHIEQADALQLRDHHSLRLNNGRLPIYLRHGTIPALNLTQSLSFLIEWAPPSPPLALDFAEDFARRLQKNLSQLQKTVRKKNIHCLRLYDADLPDYNLAIDAYGPYLHVQEYAAPKTISPEKAKQRFNQALAAIRAVTGLSRENVFIKTRMRQSGNQQYQKQSQRSKRIIGLEGNARFYINLTDYLDTGLFLDHRQIRLLIAEKSQNKHVLNLYSYTSTASVHAALAGAASTTSVDLSNTYLDWSEQNFALNGLTVDHPDQRHQFFAADCFEWLRDGSEKYDLIFIDPPTFSNSKKFSGTFEVQRDHLSLVKRAMNRLQQDGILYFSNNFRRFEMSEELNYLYDIKEITEQTIGFDFKRNQKIHRSWQIQHKAI